MDSSGYDFRVPFNGGPNWKQTVRFKREPNLLSYYSIYKSLLGVQVIFKFPVSEGLNLFWLEFYTEAVLQTLCSEQWNR